MPVESANFISQLNPASPAAGDLKSEGDDQLRVIKAAVQGSFPSLGASAVTATAAELSYVAGVTGPIQTQLNSLPPGTLPSLSGNAAKFLTNNGTTVNWGVLTDTVFALTGTDINPTNGTVQTRTHGANTTFTESIADGQSVVLMLNPSTFTTTWPTTSWVNAAGSAAAPTLKASVVNVVTLWQVGGVLYGNWAGSL